MKTAMGLDFSLAGQFITAAAALIALSGCGGGGGDSPATAPAPAPAPSPAPNLVLTGTAAGGAALIGATVEAKCATGAGSATTASDGTFTLTSSGGVLPCVLRVTAAGTTLHSVATGTGLAARANLTPVTELATARLAGDLPSTYYAAFDTAAAVALTDAAAQAAAAAVVDTLKPGGVDFGAGANMLTGPLLASHGAVAGDAYDQRLDTLKTAMASAAVTLPELTQAVARGSPVAAVASRTDTASLPPELLLAPVAPNCASLRSGRYRVVVNADGGTSPATGVITVNAPALTLVNALGATEPLVATANCTYTNADGGEIFVNKAGFAIARVNGGAGALRGAVLFPEQLHAVGEIAGDYNTLAFDSTAANPANHIASSTLTIDSTGKLTALNTCDDLRTCVAATPGTLANVTHAANVAGGFNATNATAGDVRRVFAYRPGGGELMLVSLANAGHIAFMTRNVAGSGYPVGRIRQLWNLFLGSTYTAPAAISLSKATVTSVDSAAGTYTRAAVQNFATQATRPETLQLNTPRIGYARRVGPVPAQHSDGTASTVAEFISLTLRGMDASVFALPGSNQFGISPLESTN